MSSPYGPPQNPQQFGGPPPGYPNPQGYQYGPPPGVPGLPPPAFAPPPPVRRGATGKVAFAGVLGIAQGLFTLLGSVLVVYALGFAPAMLFAWGLSNNAIGLPWAMVVAQLVIAGLVVAGSVRLTRGNGRGLFLGAEVLQWLVNAFWLVGMLTSHKGNPVFHAASIGLSALFLILPTAGLVLAATLKPGQSTASSSS